MASMVIHGGRHYPIFYYRKGALTPILMGASERLVTLSTTVMGQQRDARTTYPLAQRLSRVALPARRKGDSNGFAFP